MRIIISNTKQEAGRKAAEAGATLIRQAIRDRGQANIVLPAGGSQLEMLAGLTAAKDIPWGKVTGFHLDEYVGMLITHPASFRRFLKERFVKRLPEPLRACHYIHAEGDCKAECHRLNRLIADRIIDVAFVGIGENGHLAFNDPPADFETDEPYILVNLDEDCRRQQVNEGWFPSLEEVPTQAISMSIRQMMKTKAIICTVPERRKAEAVRAALEGPVTPQVPASILQRHVAATIFLDRDSALLLNHVVIGSEGADGR